MKTFWQSLKKPFFIQAPMDDVTDTVFRQILSQCAPPDIFFTEFTCVDALCSAGKAKTLKKLKYSETELPIVAQIWGNEPRYFYESAKLIAGLGFNGIDINLGCPDKAVLKKGAGAALIKDPQKVTEIIKAVREGAPELGLSLKTRLGLKQIQTEEWIGYLLTRPIDALTVHLRTAAELSKVPAHWEEMDKIISLRQQLKSAVLLIGNGDIKSRSEGLDKCRGYGIDGVMIGRGLLNNFWIFSERTYNPSAKEKVSLLTSHLELFKETWGESSDFNRLKKFYKYYLSGSTALKRQRLALMTLKTIEETLNRLKQGPNVKNVFDG